MKGRIEKPSLLLVFFCLFAFMRYTAKGAEADESKELHFYTIFSGNIGAGLLGERHSYTNIDGSEETDWDWNKNDPVYGFASSIRVCRLSANSIVARKMKDPSQSHPLSEQGIGGFGVEIGIRRLRHRAKIRINTSLDDPSYWWPSYWKYAKSNLSYEFRSTSFTVTPGFQAIDPKSKVGLFIGTVGIGYTQSQYINYILDTLLEIAKEEGEDIGFDIETNIAPVVFTILPISLDYLFSENMAIGLNFSGFLFYPAKTELTTKGVSNKVEWPELEFWSETYWFSTFQIGLTLSLYLD